MEPFVEDATNRMNRIIMEPNEESDTIEAKGDTFP